MIKTNAMIVVVSAFAIGLFTGWFAFTRGNDYQSTLALQSEVRQLHAQLNQSESLRAAGMPECVVTR